MKYIGTKDIENASKALILAGSILIAIIIISLGIVVFRNMSAPVQRESSLTEQQISAFNSKISPYLGESVSGSQVNALMQLVRTINTKAENENDTAKKITISYNGTPGVTRVETGNFYIVKAVSSDKGLLTTITVRDK